MREIRKEHDKLNTNLIMATRQTADIEPTVEPTGEDISQGIKDKARELGFLEVGITSADPHDEMLEELKDDVNRSLGLTGDVLAMMAEDQDYI